MLRSIKHVSTGFIPTELLFGRKFDNPIFNRPEFQLVMPDSVKDFIVEHQELVENMNEYISTAVEIMEEAKVRQKFYNDHKCSSVDFKIGDVVKKKYYSISNAIKNKTASLDPKWAGPYKIIAKIGENLFVLSEIDKDEYLTSAHSSQLYYYHLREKIKITIPDVIRIPTNYKGNVRSNLNK